MQPLYSNLWFDPVVLVVLDPVVLRYVISCLTQKRLYCTIWTKGKGDLEMTVLSIGEARNKLADVINRVSYGGERIVFARRGKPVAALVSTEDLDTLRHIEDTKDIRDAVKTLKAYAHNQSEAVTLAEYKNRRKGKA